MGRNVKHLALASVKFDKFWSLSGIARKHHNNLSAVKGKELLPTVIPLVGILPAKVTDATAMDKGLFMVWTV